MSDTIHVRPAPGKKIRYPDGRVLADTGGSVPVCSYWFRRLGFGDVIACEPPPAPTPASAPPAKEKR